MTTQNKLAYLPALFATCMVFMSVYVVCVTLWSLAPDLPGHATLGTIFPGFTLLDVPNFMYGMLMSAIYGWFVAAVFVFFHNLWVRFFAGGCGSCH